LNRKLGGKNLKHQKYLLPGPDFEGKGTFLPSVLEQFLETISNKESNREVLGIGHLA
jgi:hypothetical protein